jgi:hypothetical protein
MNIGTDTREIGFQYVIHDLLIRVFIWQRFLNCIGHVISKEAFVELQFPIKSARRVDL